MVRFLEKYESQITRVLEILPGITSWTLLTAPVWASFFVPEAVAYFIIIFDIYFFYRATHIGINSIRSYLRIQNVSRQSWVAKLNSSKLDYSKVRHIVFIPTYTEPLLILRRTLTFLSEQEFPTKQIDVCLAIESRERDSEIKASQLKKEFEATFGNFWITSHELKKGEVVGKSSNMAYAAKIVKEKIETALFDKNFLTITSCDADVAFHPKYFSHFTYQFLKNEKRYLRFWQAALVFYNNIWRVPMPVRVVHTLYSIAQVADLMRPKSIFNYSTYSASWLLVEGADFWDVDVVSEDWHLFFKCFFTNKGEVEIEPIFLPLYADAVEGQTYLKSLISQYNQSRRWAWGVTDIAYAIKEFVRHRREVSLGNFIFRFVKALEQHILWPVNWWILTLGAVLPPLVNPAFKFTALGHNLPRVSGIILTLSSVFIISVIVVDWLLKPPRPASIKKTFWPLNILQYLLMPITAFLFNSLPGMDAHTRLILGKRLDYKVTEKIIKS